MSPLAIRSTVGALLRTVVVFAFCSIFALRSTAVPDESRVTFEGSIAPEFQNSGQLQITAIDLARSANEDGDEPFPFELELAMRNFDELLQRVSRGEVIERSEMLERYYPTVAVHEETAAWLRSQGAEVEPMDSIRLAVRARAPLRRVSEVLAASFAAVEGSHGTRQFVAISAPSLPKSIARNVIAIGGLQPHVRLRPQGSLVTIGNANYLSPDFVRSHYNAGAYDGTGQVIAIMGGIIDFTDLEIFWAKNGVPQSLDNITKVNPGWRGPTEYGTIEAMEVTADVQWASAIAPAAKIRIYETIDPRRFATAILNDRLTVPGLSQASMSFGLEEPFVSPGIIQAETQYFTALAAEGINIFVSTGDSGSTVGESALSANNYDPDGTLGPSYPASVPTVMAVGGTFLQFDDAGSSVTGESAFGEPLIDGILQKGGSASGGGHSLFYPRPSWQVGAGIPEGEMRLVPDLAAVWGSSLAPAHFYFQGQDLGWGGTSLSAPVWGALCALLNQARDIDALPAIGTLGPQIYPLIGTTAFRDVTEGTNGAYFAGAGYDLCTGVGVPDIENLHLLLAAASGSTPSLPLVVQQPTSVSVAAGGNTSFTVGASGSGPFSYQWMVLPTEYHGYGDFDQAPWEPLTNSEFYTGVTSSTLQIRATPSNLNGLLYQCRVFNDHGVILTDPAILAVGNSVGPIAPLVTRQPDVVYALPGQSVDFTVRVAGTGPFSYRWVNPATFAELPGGNGDTLSFPSVTPGDTGQFLVNISGPGGSTLSSAWLLVLANPTLSVPTAVGGTVDDYFSFRIVATNYDLAPSSNTFTTEYTALGLPPGLTLNRGTGIISGYPTQAGNHTVTVSATNLLGTDTATIDFVMANAGMPEILHPPVLGSSSNPDYPFYWRTLHIAATGGALSYQWYLNGQPLSDGADYMGATTSTLSISGNATAVGGSYHVVVDNNSGRTSSTSIQIIDNGRPIFGTHPPRQQYAIPGGSVLLSAAAFYWNGQRMVPATYQWQRDGVNIAGANSSALSLENVTASDTAIYTLVATNSNGSTTSEPSRVTVLASPVITAQPATQDVVAGDDATLAINVADATALTFQWFKDNLVIPGATAPTLLLAPVGESDAGTYHAVVRGPHGSLLSATARLGVKTATAPQWLRHPRTQSGTIGGTITLTAQADGAPNPTYQWRHDNVDITNATGSTLVLTNLSPGDEGTYTVVATNRVGSSTSDPATLNLYPAGWIASQTLEDLLRSDTTVTATVASNFASLGSIERVDWDVLLPDGWLFISSSGTTEATTSAEAGASDLLTWSWTTGELNALAFSYTIVKPLAAFQPGPPDELVTLLTVTTAEGSTQYLVQPDPLRLGLRHSADSDGDSHLSLSELLRVIELYNTRSGTTRSGRYRVQSGTDDGFSPEGDNAAPPPLRFHSADSDRDGQLSLSELLRVIELYNTRTGTSRTGRYRFSPDAEDGFSPDP